MQISQESRYFVAIVGGGPSGLFAARELANRGIHTVIFNRDIKPGGLAEYGIYPSKTRMKEGLRNQFRQILSRHEVDYYSNITIGTQADLSLDDLRELGFHAILVTVGAQGAKRLGIEGEELAGVYHAKDIVYHYNALPPYSETTYQIGKRVAVIGVGNVMVDIAHWLIEEKGVEKVTAIARRGPTDVKFDRKELETVVNCLDRQLLKAELERIRPLVESVGLDPMSLYNLVEDVARKMPHEICHSSLSMRFLSTPVEILGDNQGRAIGLKVEENNLVLTDDGVTRPVGTGKHTILEVDTVIFAIGDLVDNMVGLPVEYGEFSKNINPRFPVEGSSYEVQDPRTGQILPDIFLAGWARRPSIGLVGTARKDAVNAAQVVSTYLQTVEPTSEPIPARVLERLMQLGKPVVEKIALQRLEELERQRAEELGLDFFKFSTNAEMLQVLDLA
jgi:ferredoxin/flavodoxin---NADP+ reductase